MLNHQNKFTIDDLRFTISDCFSEFIPDFGLLHQMVGLFPELDFGQFAVVPAVADDAVLRRRFAGEIIGLRGAGDCGKCGRDVGQRAALAKFRDARRVFADERFGQADDIDDGKPVHRESGRPARSDFYPQSAIRRRDVRCSS